MGKVRRRNNRPALRRQRRRLIFYFIPIIILLLVFSPPITATVLNSSVFFQQEGPNIFLPGLLDVSIFLLTAAIPGLENCYQDERVDIHAIPPLTNNSQKDSGDELNAGDCQREGQVEYQFEYTGEAGLLVDNLVYTEDELVEKTAAIPHREPQILIYHTHASESFLPDSGQAFSQNPKETVVAAGKELKEIIEDNYGIGVIHHTNFYDGNRSRAYQAAREDLADIIELFPSIEIVLDLHRDGVPRQVTTLSSHQGDKAKILLVAGTAQSKWQENYRFALHLHNSLEEVKTGLSRGVRRQNAAYNQDLHPRSLIVELGGYQNSMSETLAALPYLAEALVEIVK